MTRSVVKKSTRLLSALSLVAVVATGPALAQNAATAPAEPMRVISVDRAVIMRDSEIGKDITKQAEAVRDGFQKDAEATAKDLQGKRDALAEKQKILSPEKFQEEVGKFQQEVQSKDQELQVNLRRLQVGVLRAQADVSKELGPIFKDIMKARGANMLIEKGVVIAAPGDQDITQVVIERLNKTGKRVKLTLPDVPPAGAAQ
ncbi:MAG: OmpH family outer membrane protein [Alphaproteobacteria bacterium]